jgi:hypothetical protein
MPKNQLEPIMTNSENIAQFGNNAYGKPATALNILRESIMGRELFDYAFKEYATRWAFRHPSPADFYRTMEDASGVDLDWFWRGWFYDIEAVDISLDSVRVISLNKPSALPLAADTIKINRQLASMPFEPISQKRNRESGMIFLVDQDTSLRDFYFFYKPEKDTSSYFVRNRFENLDVVDDAGFKNFENRHYYELYFTNKGGLVMPIILRWNYEDGTSETEYISAYIWRKDENNVVKTFVKDKPVASIVLDPYKETADIDESNNFWPKTEIQSRFDLFKAKTIGRGEGNENNPMQRRRR